MKLFIKIFSTGLFALMISLTACSPTVTSQPQEPVVVIPASPGPDYVWINGSWHYNRPNRAYVHRDGYWVRPARPGRHWVEGHWVQTRRGWRYVEGHWR